jgi:hypothetical protein
LSGDIVQEFPKVKSADPRERSHHMKSKISLMFSFAITVVMMSLANVTAAPIIYVANLDGPSESPPNASPGTGFAAVTLDLALHTLEVNVTFGGLTGTTTAAHIHAPTASPFSGMASVATQTPFFVGFPIGVTSGTYDHTFDTLDTATYNAPFVTNNGGTAAGAEAALAQALADGKAYLNIHTTMVPGGEIRGFLAIPEPATIGLIAIGGMAIVVAMRNSRRG